MKLQHKNIHVDSPETNSTYLKIFFQTIFCKLMIKSLLKPTSEFQMLSKNHHSEPNSWITISHFQNFIESSMIPGKIPTCSCAVCFRIILFDSVQPQPPNSIISVAHVKSHFTPADRASFRRCWKGVYLTSTEVVSD